MFWKKKPEIMIETHCEFVPYEAWDNIPVCRDLKHSKRR